MVEDKKIKSGNFGEFIPSVLDVKPSEEISIKTIGELNMIDPELTDEEFEELLMLAKTNDKI